MSNRERDLLVCTEDFLFRVHAPVVGVRSDELRRVLQDGTLVSHAPYPSTVDPLFLGFSLQDVAPLPFFYSSGTFTPTPSRESGIAESQPLTRELGDHLE